MNKNLILAFGITVLFLGVSINPAIAVNPISSDNEEDCSICPRVSKQHLIRLRSWINRVETLNNKLLVMSKHNPKDAEIYQKLSHEISELNQDLKTDKLNIGNRKETTCDILEPVWWFLFIGVAMLFNLADSLEYSNPILFLIPLFIAYRYFARLIIITVFVDIFGCEVLVEPYSI